VLLIQVAIHGLPASTGGASAVTANDKQRTAIQVIATSFFIQFTSLPSIKVLHDKQADHLRPAYPIFQVIL
jgi:hypothetical protein